MFPQIQGKCQEICAQPSVSYFNPYHLPTDVFDVTLGTNTYWLGTWTGVGGTATLVSYIWLQPLAVGSRPFLLSFLIPF